MSRKRGLTLILFLTALIVITGCSWKASGTTDNATFHECMGDYCSDKDLYNEDSRLSFGGVVQCRDVEADDIYNWPHAHFFGQFQLNAPDQDIRAHLTMKEEAWEYGGEENIWTCDEYASYPLNQYHFIGTYRMQSTNQEGNAQVVIQPDIWGNDWRFQIEVHLNIPTSDYYNHSLSWLGYIENGNFRIIPHGLH